MAEDNVQKQALIEYIQGLVDNYEAKRKHVIATDGLHHFGEMKELAKIAGKVLVDQPDHPAKAYPDALLELNQRVKLLQLSYATEVGVSLDQPVNSEEHLYFYNLKLLANKLNQLMQVYDKERCLAIVAEVNALENRPVSTKPGFICQQLDDYLKEIGKIQDYYKKINFSQDEVDPSFLNELENLRDRILTLKDKIHGQVTREKAPQGGLFQPGAIPSPNTSPAPDAQGEVENTPKGPIK